MSERLTDQSVQDMERAVRHICRGIRSKKVRRQTEREYLEHVEDHAYRLLLRGIPGDKAITEAVAALGDPEELCHMLCAVHNRIPPERGTNMRWWILRLFAALYIGLWIRMFQPLFPALQIVPFLILFGLAPFRYLRSLFLRIRQVLHIRRVCKEKGYPIRQAASPILSVFFPARRPEWVIYTPGKTYCVHFVAVHHRRASMCLQDSYLYSLSTTHGEGVRFLDRSPYRRNLLLTGSHAYENRIFHNLYFPIGTEAAKENVERILLLNPVPSDVCYRRGSSIIYAGNGDRVLGFTLYDGNSFSKLLSKQVE